MQKIQPLIYGSYYHIYNCGINGTPIFRDTGNYKYFLRLYEKYINTIAHTYAWCLMGNHFHLLVQIKELDEIEKDVADGCTPFPDRVWNPVRETAKNKPLHLNFSHLFNSYSQAFNKQYDRHGSLFERPFKRKRIDNEIYLKQLVLYIHNNPVHHGFCDHLIEYPWSSYLVDPFDKLAASNRKIVLEWFGGQQDEFDAFHNKTYDLKEIKELLQD